MDQAYLTTPKKRGLVTANFEQFKRKWESLFQEKPRGRSKNLGTLGPTKDTGIVSLGPTLYSLEGKNTLSVSYKLNIPRNILQKQLWAGLLATSAAAAK